MRDTFYKILASIIRHILGFFLLVALLIMSACDFIGKLFGKKDTEYKSPTQLAKENQSKIMECFINKDAETIKSLLSEYIIKKYPDIDEQIDKAFNFLDGKIVSYDESFPGACGAREQKDYGATTRHIITDKGTEYKISFKGWYSYDKEIERVGITSIGVANETIVSQFKNQYKEELTKYPIRNNSLSDQLDYYNIKWQMCIGDS